MRANVLMRPVSAALLVAAAMQAASAAPPGADVASHAGALGSPAREESDIELGVHAGIAVGGGSTAGGARLGGVLLYRLSETDWFESAMAFTIGGGQSVCSAAREPSPQCQRAMLDGRSVELGAGIRRFFAPQNGFFPYAHARLGLRWVRFPDESTRGVALPLRAAFGVRTRVNDLVAVGGEIALEGGVAFFDHDRLGAEPQLGIVAQATVELGL